jgi:hypothetical protein
MSLRKKDYIHCDEFNSEDLGFPLLLCPHSLLIGYTVPRFSRAPVIALSVSSLFLFPISPTPLLSFLSSTHTLQVSSQLCLADRMERV